MIKTFTIKGKEIKIITTPDGRRAPTPDSISKMTELVMQYPDLNLDKEAQEVAKYLEGNDRNT